MTENRQMKAAVQPKQERTATVGSTGDAVQKQKENRRLLYRAGYIGRRGHGAV